MVSDNQRTLFERLRQAVRDGEHEVVRARLPGLEDKDRVERSYTLLMTAAMQNDARMIEVLVGGGASVEVERPSSWSALSLTVRARAPAAAEKLIELGADVHRALPLGSILGSALDKGATDVVRALLRAGADPCGDWAGTPMIVDAASLGDSELLGQMLEAGALRNADADTVARVTATLDALPVEPARACAAVLREHGVEGGRITGVEIDRTGLTRGNFELVQTLTSRESSEVYTPFGDGLKAHISPERVTISDADGNTCVISVAASGLALRFSYDARAAGGSAAGASTTSRTAPSRWSLRGMRDGLTRLFQTGAPRPPDVLDPAFTAAIGAHFRALADHARRRQAARYEMREEVLSPSRRTRLRDHFLPFVELIAGEHSEQVLPAVRLAVDDPQAYVDRVTATSEQPHVHGLTTNLHVYALIEALAEVGRVHEVDWKFDLENAAGLFEDDGPLYLIDIGTDSYVIVQSAAPESELLSAARAAGVDFDRLRA